MFKDVRDSKRGTSEAEIKTKKKGETVSQRRPAGTLGVLRSCLHTTKRRRGRYKHSWPWTQSLGQSVVTEAGKMRRDFKERYGEWCFNVTKRGTSCRQQRMKKTTEGYSAFEEWQRGRKRKKKKEKTKRGPFERLWGVTTANREWHNEWVRTGGRQTGKTH